LEDLKFDSIAKNKLLKENYLDEFENIDRMLDVEIR
jgi:hypothetical protein